MRKYLRRLCKMARKIKDEILEQKQVRLMMLEAITKDDDNYNFVCDVSLAVSAGLAILSLLMRRRKHK